jgi:hypothetical protein
MPRRKTSTLYVNKLRLKAGLPPIAVRTHEGVSYAADVVLLDDAGHEVARLRLSRDSRVFRKHHVSVALSTKLQVVHR